LQNYWSPTAKQTPEKISSCAKNQPRIIYFFDISVSNEYVIYFKIPVTCLLNWNLHFVSSMAAITLHEKT
jgi:hypothetical protein